MSDLRALTIRQPGASLIAAGVQTIHTDKRRTSYRGPVLIHAGKAKPSRCARCRGFGYEQVGAADVDCCSECGGCGMAWPWAEAPPRLPLGAVVAVARVTDCVPIRDESAGLAAYWPNWNAFWIGVDGLGDLHLWDRDIGVIGLGHQLPYADFTPGRWALLLYDVRPVHVPDVKGRPGLWTPDPDLTRRVKEAT